MKYKNYRRICRALREVNHYYFYIRDEEVGGLNCKFREEIDPGVRVKFDNMKKAAELHMGYNGSHRTNPL